jgi:hypothetical protein
MSARLAILLLFATQCVAMKGYLLPESTESASVERSAVTVTSPYLPQLWDRMRGGDPADWAVEERGPSAVWGRDRRVVDQSLATLACSVAETLTILGGPIFTGRTTVVLIDNATAWDDLLSAGGFRPDGLALHVADEIYLLVDGEGLRPERLAHESVHRVLRDVVGRIPLWLDEGLASYLGWRAARICRSREGFELTQSYPVCDGALLAWSDITSRRAYPPDPQEARLFYRQSEELVTAIAEAVGDANLLEYAKAVARRPARWQKILASRWGMSESDLKELEVKVEARMRTAWRR